MKLVLKIKTVYGKDLIYPSCVNSLLFAQISRKETFSYSQIALIEQLGYTITYVSNHLTK